MANVMVGSRVDVDYSLVDGRIRRFEYEGSVLYDEAEGIEAFGWVDFLLEEILLYGMHIDYGDGVMAFVTKLEEEGLLTIVSARRK